MTYVGIALSGKACSGKDSIYGAMTFRSDAAWTRYAFADELKDMASELTGLNFHDPAVKKQHRQFLIDLGQAMRTYQPDFWLQRTLDAIADAQEQHPHIVPVITDVRFKNEAERLRELGFLMVRVDTPMHIRAARGSTVAATLDVSEIDLDEWDFDLYVDGTVNPGENANFICHEARGHP